MQILYNKNCEEELEKAKKNNFIVLFVLLTLMIIIFILSVVLATYKERKIYEVVTSILLVILSMPLAYLIAKNSYLKNLLYDYSVIKEKDGDIVKCKVVKISHEEVTLPDKMKVFEIGVLFNDESGKVYSLSNLFNSPFEIGKEYKLLIVSDYIKGYEEL